MMQTQSSSTFIIHYPYQVQERLFLEKIIQHHQVFVSPHFLCKRTSPTFPTPEECHKIEEGHKTEGANSTVACIYTQ